MEKLVDYYTYCKECVHYKGKETDDPCDECLRFPVNEDTHKPVNFEPKEAK